MIQKSMFGKTLRFKPAMPQCFAKVSTLVAQQVQKQHLVCGTFINCKLLANCLNVYLQASALSFPCFWVLKHLKPLSGFHLLFTTNTFSCFLNMLELFPIILSMSTYLNFLTNNSLSHHIFFQLSCRWETQHGGHICSWRSSHFMPFTSRCLLLK